MVVRIHNIDKWKRLPAGDVLGLGHGGARLVRVDLNCPTPTHVAYSQGEVVTFLAVVHGLQTLEFATIEADEEPLLVLTGEDDAWYFTDEGDHAPVENLEAKSFTKLATRRARNPELERLQFIAEQNMNNRMARLEEEYARRFENMARSVDRETGEVIDHGTADEAQQPPEKPVKAAKPKEPDNGAEQEQDNNS